MTEDMNQRLIEAIEALNACKDGDVEGILIENEGQPIGDEVFRVAERIGSRDTLDTLLGHVVMYGVGEESFETYMHWAYKKGFCRCFLILEEIATDEDLQRAKRDGLIK